MIEIFVLLVILLITVLIYWIIDHQNYFKKHNVPYLKSIPLIGAFSDVVLGKKGIYENFVSIYENEKLKDEPFFGIFLFHKPAIFIKDPELVKRILVTDFNTFNDRYSSSDTHDPLGYYQILFSKNPLWKFLRKKLSPFFSKAKLKAAYYMIENHGTQLEKYIEGHLENKSCAQLEVKAITDLFFIDVIASTVFGVEAHSLTNEKSEFETAARSLNEYSFWRGLEFSALFFLPKATKLFGFKNFGTLCTKFIYKLMPHVISEREKSGIKRNDLIDTLIELKNQPVAGSEMKMTDDMLYAQAGIFLNAGKL